MTLLQPGVARWRRANAIDTDFIADDGAASPYIGVGNNIAQVGGSNGVVDVFGDSATEASTVLVQSAWLNITATDDGSANETYVWLIEESDTNVFTIVRKFTSFTVLRGTSGAAKIGFTPNYRFVRFNYFTTGTTPSISIEKGFLSPEPV